MVQQPSSGPVLLRPIAVTGVSVLFPGSADTESFWRDVLAGKDLIQDVPEAYWSLQDYYDPDPNTPDRTYSRRGGFIPEVPFDPLANGLPPKILPVTDNAQLLALIVAERVLNDAARGQFLHIDRKRISVILGATGTTELISHMSGRIERPRWEAALRASGLEEEQVHRLADRIAEQFEPWQENTFPGFLGNVIAGRIAYRLDLGGTNCVVDAACASSLAAVRMAVQELQTGDSDLVITGGVDALNVPLMYMAFSKTGALSRTGDCRPYSDKADGTILGDGVGMLALRRLEDAERDGDRIYAVLRGLGSSSDGRAKSIYAPVAEGQALAIQRAYESAGFTPDTVELVEGHGTGTIAGDKAEVGGLTQGFDGLTADGHPTRRQWCALGSIKSQIGHLKGAAGVAGLFKAIMALHHKVLPPTIKVDRPNPAFDLPNTPFYVNTRLRPWVRDSSHPRRAGVSSAGFGGTNFHVVLEEYVGPAAKASKTRPASAELVLVATETAAELVDRCKQLVQECNEHGTETHGLQRVARRSQERFSDNMPARLAIVASDLHDLKQKFLRAVQSIGDHPDREVNDPSGIYFSVGKQPGEVAFLFPGQGSQYVNAGQDLALYFDAAREVWDQTAELEFGGVRVHEVVFPVPAFGRDEEAEQGMRLTRTEWAQPALAMGSMAGVAVLKRLGLEPAFVAGHSFGELSALCAAGAFSLLDLVRAARRRGELMSAASDIPGAMTAVRGSVEQIEKALGGRHPEVRLANRNSPRQVVLSGPTDSIAAAERELTASSLPFKRLPVATAFHSPLVSPSVAPFRDFLSSIPLQPTRMTVYANATAEPYPRDASEAKELLARQIASPVRFEEVVRNLARQGVRTFVEVGAGNVLTSLVGECLSDQPHLAVSLDRKNQPGLTSLWHALGQMAVQGVPLNWSALWQDHQDLPPASPPPAHAVMIGGSSKGRRLDESPVAPRQPVMPHNGTIPASPAPVVESTRQEPRPVTTDTTKTPVLMSHRNGQPTRPQESTPPLQKQKIVNSTNPSNRLPATGDSHWSQTLQGILTETAKAHETYQNLMAQSCQRFFESLDSTVRHFTRNTARLSAELPHRPEVRTERNPAPVPEAKIPAVMTEAPSLSTTEEQVPTVFVPPKQTAISPAAVSPVTQGVDLAKELIKLVAEKTGYPVDLLTLDMDMESGLGIDSIKRVEIMSALEAIAPGLSAVEPSQMFGLRTLADIVDLLRKTTGNTAAPVPSAIVPAALPPAEKGVDLAKELIKLVAEKTGYPVDLLTLDMDMESGLGIDSIKRVEIMSALEAIAPGLSAVEPSQLFGLRTLADIVELLRKTTGNGAAPAPSGPEAMLPRATSSPRVDFPRYVVRAVDSPASGFALPRLKEASPLVLLTSLDDDSHAVTELAFALADKLRKKGLDVAVSCDLPRDARGVIFLGGLRPVRDADQAYQVQREAFEAARSFAPTALQTGGIFVTVQDTGGDFGLSGCGTRAWVGGLAGLAKTAAAEWPKVSVKAIDLEQGGRSADVLATILARELLEGGSEIEVGLPKDGRRLSLVCEPSPLPSNGDHPVVADGDVIVVSGGARGVTAAALKGLVALCRPRFVLLGRTPLQTEPVCCRGLQSEAELTQALQRESRTTGREVTLTELRSQARQILQQREIEENLMALRSAGAQVRYLNVDVRDQKTLTEKLAVVRREWGPIRGIVHGAGVLADRLIKDITLDQLDQVYSVKIDGLRALLGATHDDPLKLLCLFSSVAGRFGNPGQSAYSMANEVLNKVADAEQRRRGKNCLVKSFNWGAWEGGMVTPVLKERFESRGVRLLPLEEGGRQFAAEVTSGAPGVEVVLGAADFTDPLRTGTVVPTEFDVSVDLDTPSFLHSHCVEEGVPVLPAVLVLEWFVRVGQKVWPGQPVICRDFKVLAGVPFRDTERANWFRIVHQRNLDGTVEVELRRGNTKHYSAVLEPRSAQAHTQEASFGTHGVNHRNQLPAQTTYDDGLLFHGPHFQVLKSLDELTGETGHAELFTTDELGWPEGSWLTDPAALDGGLQLAILWGLKHKYRKSLPTGFESYTPRDAFGERVGRCDLRVRRSGRHEVVADLLFSTAEGRPVAELHGVTMTLLQGSKEKVAR